MWQRIKQFFRRLFGVSPAPAPLEVAPPPPPSTGGGGGPQEPPG